MEKYAVVSSNNNPDYFFFAPYQKKAWNKYGWKLVVMVTDDVTEEIDCDSLIKLPAFDGVRTATVAQASRLYAANHLPEDALIMTCDMDLIPLSDYWHPNPEKISVYGHDLTWFSFYPMGYCAMTGSKWKEKFHLSGDTYADMMRDFDKYKDMVHSDNWEIWWNYDWRLLTDTLMKSEKEIDFINRGQIDIAGGTLAKGRIDRFNWDATQNQPEPFIDMHCDNNNVQHPEKLEKFLSVFNKFHG